MYRVGTFVGEEWIYFKNYVEREETCIACEASCALEIDVEQFEAIRGQLLDLNMKKDIVMLES